MISADIYRYSSIDLPDTPHTLFTRGELADAVGAPDGDRVEVIGGQVVVSPAPELQHGAVIEQISRALHTARLSLPDFPWEWQQAAHLSLGPEKGGCIPDLVVGDEGVFEGAWELGTVCLAADEVELVVEVTSRGNAWQDRPPTGGQTTKWVGYARAEIPYYLLVDRDPKDPRSVLYTIPDARAGAYLDKQVWAFGESIVLPEPFGLKIPTGRWRPWK